MFFQEYCFTLPGVDKNWHKRINEDAYGIAGVSAWVLDGATDVHGKVGKTGVHDFISALNAAMMNVADMPFEYRLSCGISEAVRHFELTGLTEQEAPTFAVAGVRVKGDIAECYLLGDSYIVIKHKEQPVKIFKDTRIEPFRAQNRKRISQKSATVTANDIYRETRNLANKPGGYPIGSTAPKSAEYGITINEQIQKGDRILLLTDGLDGYLGNSVLRLEKFLYGETIDDEFKNACAYYDEYGKGRDDMTEVLLVML